MVNIGDMQFLFMQRHSTTDDIFLVRHFQEKYLDKKKKLYFAFADMEKGF